MDAKIKARKSTYDTTKAIPIYRDGKKRQFGCDTKRFARRASYLNAGSISERSAKFGLTCNMKDARVKALANAGEKSCKS